jgi:HD-GYP domain-containing protein (c-di-GMP phosphodiesterase class II)
LSDKEFDIIKRHPETGYQILKSVDEYISIAKYVLHHHERWDGTGYPAGLKGTEIPLQSRIIAVADAYEAMTSNRVYKKKATPFAAFEMFMTEGYTNFDTYITNKFISNMSTYLIGSEVLLSNGERGKIVYVPPESMLKPIIYSNGRYFSEDDDGINIEAMI